MLYHGIDTVDFGDFATALSRHDGLKARLFTEKELSLTLKQLAGNFACKEALFKALNELVSLTFHDCEITRQESGKPKIFLLGPLKEQLDKFQIEASITNSKNLITASVIVYDII